MTRFELDTTCRRLDGGRILMGGSPLTMFRLGEAGARVLDLIASGKPAPFGSGSLIDRLLEAGAIHPVCEPHSGPTSGEVTLVIPAFSADRDRIIELARATEAARTIVIDDASPTPLTPLDGVEVVRLEVNSGPGFARQHGLSLVTTPFVAFVDTDVVAPRRWLADLLPGFADERVGLVAPRVRADPGSAAPEWLTRFEQVRSPLDLGARRARVRAGTRVSYVPSAAIVCRVDALRSIGGFDTELRLGEDVDLVWRLDAAGWRCRYEPSVSVFHEVRHDLRSWTMQRVGYGSSSAELARRHGRAVAPFRAPVASTASWLTAACGAPALGVLGAAASTAALARRLPEMPERAREAARLAALGQLHTGSMLASALTRTWWPPALLAALVSRRWRRVLIAAVVLPSILDWWKVRRSVDPLRYTALRTLDDAAYGAGVWKGAVRARSGAALVPEFTDLDSLRRGLLRRIGRADEPEPTLRRR